MPSASTRIYSHRSNGRWAARATHEVVTVMTLTENAGALYVNDFPVAIVLVWGVMVSGAPGTLLVVCGPVSSWSVPEPATVLNWLRSNVRLCVVFAAFATWEQGADSGV